MKNDGGEGMSKCVISDIDSIFGVSFVIYSVNLMSI